MRQYTFKLVIPEGSDEFWDELENDGIEEVKKLIKDCLENSHFHVLRCPVGRTSPLQILELT